MNSINSGYLLSVIVRQRSGGGILKKKVGAAAEVGKYSCKQVFSHAVQYRPCLIDESIGPAVLNTMPPVSRMSSSTYWVPPSRSHSMINSMKDSGAGSMSSSGDSTMPRHYIDPWDLENYAYLKRHCSDLMMDSDPIVSLGTNGLDSAYSDFYYVPSHEAEMMEMNAKQLKTQRSNSHRQLSRRQSMIIPEESNALMAAAGIEEEDFYNEKYEVSPPVCCHHHNKTFRRHSTMVPYVEYEDHHPVRFVPFSRNGKY